VGRGTSELLGLAATLAGKIAAREVVAKHGLQESEPDRSWAWREILSGMAELMLRLRQVDGVLIPLEEWIEAKRCGRGLSGESATAFARAVSALASELTEKIAPLPSEPSSVRAALEEFPGSQLKIGGDSGNNPPP
jgi:hypothetical protein